MARKVAYLGPPGTFSEAAAIAHDAEAELVPFPRISAVAQAVEAGDADEGIVPIENSIEGPVTDTLDLLIHESTLSICKELVLPITHCLLVKPGTKLEAIRVVFSIPQALGQCRRFIEGSLAQAQVVAALSTVAGVEDMRAYDGPSAAIAPRRAAELYPVEVLVEGIQDRADNVTRFIVLAFEDHPPTGDDKTSIAFLLDDRPKQLYNVIKQFAERDINLSKIESRPAKGSLGRYVFLLDFDRHREDADAKEALAGIAPSTNTLKIFGSYPRFRSG